MIDIFLEFNKFNFITFQDQYHTYTTDDGERYSSVSKFISKYSKPFDSDKISMFVAKKRGITQDQVLYEWSTDRVKGTVFHLLAEGYLSNKIVNYPIEYIKSELRGLDPIRPRVDKIFNMFTNFANHSKGRLIPIKSELVIADKELKLGGMIDQVFYNTKAEEFQLWDWKTNKSINEKNDYGEKMLDPISHLDSCELVKYSIQLAMYKHMIEKNTNIKLGKSYIAWFNENNDTYKCFETLELNDELPILIDKYRTDNGI